jgi:hypothetical protein
MYCHVLLLAEGFELSFIVTTYSLFTQQPHEGQPSLSAKAASV